MLLTGKYNNGDELLIFDVKSMEVIDGELTVWYKLDGKMTKEEINLEDVKTYKVY